MNLFIVYCSTESERHLVEDVEITPKTGEFATYCIWEILPTYCNT